MERSRFTKEQILGHLKAAEAGTEEKRPEQIHHGQGEHAVTDTTTQTTTAAIAALEGQLLR